MKLIKITKSGSLHFKWSDGRKGISYKNGYVRTSVKRPGRFIGSLYQINKVKKIYKGSLWGGWDYRYERVLITCPQKRYEFLLNFDNNNCK